MVTRSRPCLKYPLYWHKRNFAMNVLITHGLSPSHKVPWVILWVTRKMSRDFPEFLRVSRDFPCFPGISTAFPGFLLLSRGLWVFLAQECPPPPHTQNVEVLVISVYTACVWPHTSNLSKCLGQPLSQLPLTLELWPYYWGGSVIWKYPYSQNFSQIGPAVTEI